MLIEYPSDWSDEEDDPNASSDDSPVVHIMLRPKPPGGLRKWLDGQRFHVTDHDWVNSSVSVDLQKVPSFHGLDAEIARLEPFVRQMGRGGMTYTFLKSTCAAGPVLGSVGAMVMAMWVPGVWRALSRAQR